MAGESDGFGTAPFSGETQFGAGTNERFARIDTGLVGLLPSYEEVSGCHEELAMLRSGRETLVFAENDGLLTLMDRFGVTSVLERITGEYRRRPDAVNPYSLLRGYMPERHQRENFYAAVGERIAAQQYPRSWGADYFSRHAAESLRASEGQPPGQLARIWSKNSARELGALLTHPSYSQTMHAIFEYAETATGVSAMRLDAQWERSYQAVLREFRKTAAALDIHPAAAQLRAELAELERLSAERMRAGVMALKSAHRELVDLPETADHVQALVDPAEAAYAVRVVTLHNAVSRRLVWLDALLKRYEALMR